jgi:hypothetical protein
VRHDQRKTHQLVAVFEGIERIGNFDGKTLILQRALENARDLFGLMSIPSAPDDQCFASQSDSFQFFPPDYPTARIIQPGEIGYTVDSKE